MADKAKPGAIRATSFEVHAVDGDWCTVTDRWHVLAEQLKELVNCFFQTWELWHVQHSSRQKLQEWLDARQAAADAVEVPVWKSGKKRGQWNMNKYNTLKTRAVNAVGKCPVEAFSKELNRLIRRTCADAFPAVHSRVLTLKLNTLTKDFTKHKASKGRLPGHSAVLLYHQERPSATRPQPIPFDRQNVGFIPPEKRGGNYRLSMRLSRVGDRVVSPPDVVTLRCQGKGVRSQVAILKRIVSGEYEFCGSQLVYSRAKGKWFAQIAYRMPRPEKSKLDSTRTAILRPRKSWPWTFWAPGQRRSKPGGWGRYVAPVRKGVIMQRWQRRANYKQAGHANKGHGRTRAGAGPQWKLQQSWKNFAKRVNQSITTEVVERCVAAGAGRLIYVQPDDDFAETRFLGMAGKVPGRRDASGWPWFQVATFLKYKCQEKGIELVVEKRSRGSFSDRNATKT